MTILITTQHLHLHYYCRDQIHKVHILYTTVFCYS